MSEVNITLELAIKIATAMDAAQKDAIELRGNVSVQKLYKDSNKTHAKPSRPPQHVHKCKEKDPCFRCTKRGHDPNDWYYKNERCHNCGKVGHNKKACRSKVTKGGPSSHTVHHIESESEDDYGIAYIELWMNFS